MSNFNIFDDDDVFENTSFFDHLESGALNIPENINTSNNKLNVSALCCDEEISGYDKLMGRTWIYPTNYPVRDYQYNIIKATILQNTLVSLPTGLGKTFIAAVIMYNYYRWYPTGKILFTAPTRPLVAQQIEACYNVCAVPPADTIEMTGHMQVNTRKLHWKSKRVFFATPQVIYNDIKSGICPANKIRCLVFDEAHKARGNYAYCQIISSLNDLGHKTYRVLALSATPGSKVEDVCNVIKNLKISHLELKTENCIDVSPYSHSRSIKTVVIALGPELSRLRDHYLKIVDGYARRLQQMNILPSNIGNLSKGRLVMLYKEYQTRDRVTRHPQHNYIMKDFVILISLFHGLELLVKHGARVFLNFFDEHTEKTWMQEDDQITGLLETLRDDLGLNPMSLNTSILPDGTIPEIPKDLQFGHPKFDKLKEIMLDHFTKSKEKGQETKAIVFCEYRESVNLVHCLLLQCRPLILPQTFVGQGATGKDGRTVVSQKQQLRVMRSFRSGTCNVLVATCVAEEGLDVGSVDLCLCFDISTRSPIRLVQRCGRTGRERGGQVYILVTEGKEHQTLQDCMRQKDAITKKVLHSKEIESSLYSGNPRMLPRDHIPTCQKMHITVEKKPEPIDKSKSIGKPAKAKGQKDIRSMLLDKATSSSSFGSSDGKSCQITKEQFERLFPDGYLEKPYFKEREQLFSCNKEHLKLTETNDNCREDNDMSKWLEWQRKLQTTVNIGHSSDSRVLADILQYCDKKRFDIPVLSQFFNQPSQPLCTQTITMKSPTKQKETKKKQKQIQSPGKRDGDIRALFSGIKSTKSYTKVVNDLGLKNDQHIPTVLLDLLVELSINKQEEEKATCKSCENIINNEIMNALTKTKDTKPKKCLAFLTNPVYPDINLLNEIDIKCFENYALNKTCNKSEMSIDEEVNINNNNDEVEICVEDKSKSINRNDDLNFSLENSQSMCTNFDIGNIEDIFDDSPPKESENVNDCVPKETLQYFGLHSIDDIFANSDDSVESVILLQSDNVNDKENKKDHINVKPIPISPSVLSGLCNKNISNHSPILTTQNCSTPIRSKTVKNLSKMYIGDQSRINMPNNSQSMLSQSEILAMINAGEVSTTSHDKSVQISCDNRSGSPIFLTQNVRRNQKLNISIASVNEEKSIVIESSGDDSDDTVDYNIREEIGKIHQIIKLPKNPTPRPIASPKDSLIVESSFFQKTPNPISPLKKPLEIYKQKKKKPKTNGFLDLEAELGDSLDRSGDELTDDSLGSVAEFIDDDKSLSQDNMHAVYLQSVRSPIKGTFKIPKNLPEITENIYSQAVVDDNEYEFDSFTVDSHVGLTQVQDLSELEIAERKLNALRKARKKSKMLHRNRIEPRQRHDSNDSFVVGPIQTNKRKFRVIDSDSDDSF